MAPSFPHCELCVVFIIPIIRLKSLVVIVATSRSSQHQPEKSAEGLAPAVRISITECNIKMYDLTVPSASGITASAPWGSPSLAADPHQLDMPLPSSGRGGWMDAGMIYSHWVSESPSSYEAMKYTVEAEAVAASGGEDYPTNLLRGVSSKIELCPCIYLNLSWNHAGRYFNMFSARGLVGHQFCFGFFIPVLNFQRPDWSSFIPLLFKICHACIHVPNFPCVQTPYVLLNGVKLF